MPRRSQNRATPVGYLRTYYLQSAPSAAIRNLRPGHCTQLPDSNTTIKWARGTNACGYLRGIMQQHTTCMIYWERVHQTGCGRGDRSHKGKGWSNNLLRKSLLAAYKAGRALGSAGVAIPLHGNAKSTESTVYPRKMQLWMKYPPRSSISLQNHDRDEGENVTIPPKQNRPAIREIERRT